MNFACHSPSERNVPASPPIAEVTTPRLPLVWGPPALRVPVGLAYRFEAYIPRERPRLGYYAMPLSWGEDVIGWVNCIHRRGILDIGAGHVTERDRGAGFARTFNDETPG